MAYRERPRDRGARIGRETLITLGREARQARIRTGLSQRAVAEAAGVDRSWVARFELGMAPGIAYLVVATILGVVGLDLSARAFPLGDPLRDAPRARLIERFLVLVASTVARALEVPFPNPGDPRAWDLRLRIRHSTWGVEAETRVGDLQATLRRLAIKKRDGMVDGLILVLADTAHHRAMLREHRLLLTSSFPGDPRAALDALRAGRPPATDTILVL
jgi:transcriptional regulator with XRE-family HTH domain